MWRCFRIENGNLFEWYASVCTLSSVPLMKDTIPNTGNSRHEENYIFRLKRPTNFHGW